MAAWTGISSTVMWHHTLRPCLLAMAIPVPITAINQGLPVSSKMVDKVSRLRVGCILDLTTKRCLGVYHSTWIQLLNTAFPFFLGLCSCPLKLLHFTKKNVLESCRQVRLHTSAYSNTSAFESEAQHDSPCLLIFSTTPPIAWFTNGAATANFLKSLFCEVQWLPHFLTIEAGVLCMTRDYGNWARVFQETILSLNCPVTTEPSQNRS